MTSVLLEPSSGKKAFLSALLCVILRTPEGETKDVCGEEDNSDITLSSFCSVPTVDLEKEVGELEVQTCLVLVVHAITVQGVVSAILNITCLQCKHLKWAGCISNYTQ